MLVVTVGSDRQMCHTCRHYKTLSGRRGTELSNVSANRKHSSKSALMGKVTIQSSRHRGDGEAVNRRPPRGYMMRKVHRLDFSGNGTQTPDLPYNLCMMQYMRYGVGHVNI